MGGMVAAGFESTEPRAEPQALFVGERWRHDKVCRSMLQSNPCGAASATFPENAGRRRNSSINHNCIMRSFIERE
jgi:hypothetical protein